MLKRLAILVGIVFAWFIAALIMPIVFWVFSGIIIGLSVWHMAKTGKRHAPGTLFTGVGVGTAVVATLGFLIQPDASDYADDPEALAAMVATGELSPEDAAEIVEEAQEEAQEEAREAQEEAEAADPGVTERVANTTEGLKQAKAIAKKKKLCKDPAAVSAAWQLLSTAQPHDKNYSLVQAAVGKLEGCRAKMVGALAKSIKTKGAKNRAAFAKQLQKDLAKQSKKIKVKAAGKGKTKMTIKWPKASPEAIAAAVGAPDGDGVLGQAQAAGFVNVKVTGGKKPTSFDLAPMTEMDAANERLAEQGLGEALALP